MLAAKLIIAGMLVSAALWATVRRQSPSRTVLWALLLSASLLGAFLVLLPANRMPADPQAAQEETDAPARGGGTAPDSHPAYDAGYVGADACRECHHEQYGTWHHSYHRTMTQEATPDSVVPDWDGVTLKSRGRTYHLQRRGDEFWVDMPDPAAELQAAARGVDLTSLPQVPRVQERVVMTTGSHHHQTYWVRQASGALVQVPWVYHINTDRWVFRTDSFLRPPVAEASFNIWNVSCIGCHATGGRPRVNARTRTMHSVGELGISCEACHGPGADHVAYHRADEKTAPREDPICNPSRQPPADSAHVCGQCHLVVERTDLNRWLAEGDPFRPCGENFTELRRVVRYTEEGGYTGRIADVDTRFWPDGTVRIGGREYTGLIESACYQRGRGHRKLTCISCHSMHYYEDRNHQLASGMDANAACTQCHTEPRYGERIAEHTHHDARSSGSQCYNCHMPHTSYALFQATRSHRIQSPDVAVTLRTGRPNACNLCHLDKTLAFTAEHLHEWYGQPALKLPDEHRRIAASVLWLLRGDAAQRSVTAWNVRRQDAQEVSGAAWPARHLLELLDDPYSAVRYIAYQSLRSFPGYEDFVYDFDAPHEQRRKARDEALLRWNGVRRDRAPFDRPHVLLDGEGRARREIVARLLGQRDDRRIVISE